jgi:hypothetical protein
VNANLIRVEISTNGAERWLVHPLLRDYARELLERNVRRSVFEKKYVDYFTKAAMEFEDQFNQSVIHPEEFSNATSEICHAVELAIKHGWNIEAASLIRASISPMISMGQFHALRNLEKYAVHNPHMTDKEKALLQNLVEELKNGSNQ